MTLLTMTAVINAACLKWTSFSALQLDFAFCSSKCI